MNITLVLYLIELINNINQAAQIVLTATAVITIILIICFFTISYEYSKEEHQTVINTSKLLYKKIWISVLALFIAIVLPEKNTMYLMLGTSVLSSSGLPEKVTEAINLKIDSVISNFKAEKEKELKK